MGLLKLITKGRTTTSFALQSYKAPLEAIHVHTPGPQGGLASCHTLPALGIRESGWHLPARLIPGWNSTQRGEWERGISHLKATSPPPPKGSHVILSPAKQIAIP